MPREVVLLGTKLAFVLFAFITAAVIASIVIPCVIISSILIARRATAIIVVHVFALVVGSVSHAVVIGGGDFFIGVFLRSDFFLLGVRHLEGFGLGVRFFRTDSASDT